MQMKQPTLDGQAGGRGDGTQQYWGANLPKHVWCEMMTL